MTRIGAFSDAVFAIAITLLALDLRLPAGDGALLSRLRALGSAYASFGSSFLTIGLYWMGHHRMFRSITRYDTVLLGLDLLLCIAFIPFPTSVSGASNTPTAAVFYSLTLAGTNLVLGGLWLYASVGGRLPARPLDRHDFRVSTARVFLPAGLFLLSAAVALGSPTIARVLWYVIALAVYALDLRLDRGTTVAN